MASSFSPANSSPISSYAAGIPRCFHPALVPLMVQMLSPFRMVLEANDVGSLIRRLCVDRDLTFAAESP